MELKTFSQLKRNQKELPPASKRLRIAVLGDSTTQLLAQALRGAALDRDLDLQIWEADFNQIERQILDPGSDLYEFKPEAVVVFQATHKMLCRYDKLSGSERGGFASAQLQLIDRLHESIRENLRASVVFYNFPEIDDAVFGSYANKVEPSFLFQLRKLNYELMLMAARVPSFFVCDLSSIQNRVGRRTMFQGSIYVNTEMVLTTEVLPAVAAKTLDVLDAMRGKARKCVVLDLDNTLWGGVIGDDGIENIEIGSLGVGKAYTEFQCWLKKLKERGIILAVCSKNTEVVAKEPFEKHPDMMLRLEDIAVFVANWDNKINNIRQIQQTLNIGFDSMVLLDDSPFERQMVRENLPGVCVPNLPEDPSDYLEYLYSLNLFETASFSVEDAERTAKYAVETQRRELKEKFANEDGFLRSLGMVSAVEHFNKFNTPRVAQLSQRSNQFNLRTVRYTEAGIADIAASANHFGFSFTLEDKFGDNGLICVVILAKLPEEALFIDSWFMSCRVLKRGMENFVLNTLVEFARSKGCERLIGEYLPTSKNQMVEDHYRQLGFSPDGGRWILQLSRYRNARTFISRKST
ncbi:MAG TPA: HAD-IIIC family phosphatase [Terriglobia bacterium]|nr:HAD-IIIC family phosphatase [Terriglobia bacterium]